MPSPHSSHDSSTFAPHHPPPTTRVPAGAPSRGRASVEAPRRTRPWRRWAAGLGLGVTLLPCSACGLFGSKEQPAMVKDEQSEADYYVTKTFAYWADDWALYLYVFASEIDRTFDSPDLPEACTSPAATEVFHDGDIMTSYSGNWSELWSDVGLKHWDHVYQFRIRTAKGVKLGAGEYQGITVAPMFAYLPIEDRRAHFLELWHMKDGESLSLTGAWEGEGGTLEISHIDAQSVTFDVDFDKLHLSRPLKAPVCPRASPPASLTATQTEPSPAVGLPPQAAIEKLPTSFPKASSWVARELERGSKLAWEFTARPADEEQGAPPTFVWTATATDSEDDHTSTFAEVELYARDLVYEYPSVLDATLENDKCGGFGCDDGIYDNDHQWTVKAHVGRFLLEATLTGTVYDSEDEKTLHELLGGLPLDELSKL